MTASVNRFRSKREDDADADNSLRFLVKGTDGKSVLTMSDSQLLNARLIADPAVMAAAQAVTMGTKNFPDVFKREDLESILASSQRVNNLVNQDGKLNFEAIQNFDILGVVVNFRENESHPMIPLRNYKFHDECLAAKKAVDEDVEFITYDDLSQ